MTLAKTQVYFQRPGKWDAQAGSPLTSLRPLAHIGMNAQRVWKQAMANWLSRIYLRTLGVQADDEAASQLGAVHAWLGCAFVVVAAPIVVAVNLVTLLFGVSVNFLGRDGVRFSFLRLWGPVRAIYVMLPVMLGYGIWHKLQTTGAAVLVSSMAATLVAAIASLALMVLVNRLRSER